MGGVSSSRSHAVDLISYRRLLQFTKRIIQSKTRSINHEFMHSRKKHLESKPTSKIKTQQA